MRLGNAIRRSYQFSRQTWLFPRYRVVSVLVMAAALLVVFFQIFHPPELIFLVAAFLIWFAEWAKRDTYSSAQPIDAMATPGDVASPTPRWRRLATMLIAFGVVSLVNAIDFGIEGAKGLREPTNATGDVHLADTYTSRAATHRAVVSGAMGVGLGVAGMLLHRRTAASLGRPS